jgi:ribosomal-protein-alanine N-acetyltransferase
VDTHNFIRKVIAFQHERPRRHFEVAVVLKAENYLIGSCGIHISELNNQQGQIGYCYNRHYWGQGYATEAAQALIKFGFDQLSLHRIFAFTDPKNIVSQRVLEKVGMQREGYLQDNQFYKDKWHDSLLYAVVNYEWERFFKA